MTPDDVAERVTAIAAEYDDESAHALEDELHREVLIVIAAEASDVPHLLAREALNTVALDFSRWYA